MSIFFEQRKKMKKMTGKRLNYLYVIHKKKKIIK